MDQEIKGIVDEKEAFYNKLIQSCQEQIEQIKGNIAGYEKCIKAVKDRACKACTLNRSCHHWKSCWTSGKLACENCTGFETTSQYSKRMDKESKYW